MKLGACLDALAERMPQSYEHFARDLPMKWVETALKLTDTATVRRRRLPSEMVVWLVIGMGLYRDRAITDLVDKLDLALPGAGGTVMASSSIAEARARIGDAALELLFDMIADAWGHDGARSHAWRGLALYGVDGTTIRVPDSPVNSDFFGRMGSKARGESGYPIVRLVTLMALRSRLLVGAKFGPNATSETAYAADLWPRVPDQSLTIVDRGFFGARVLFGLTRSGQNRHWMTRAKSNLRWRVVKSLGPGDELVEMKVSAEARRVDPTLPATWQMRAVRYQRPGFEPQVLLTSLLDTKAYPRDELAALYHERWELELAFDEMKTEMLAREEAIRSRTVNGVYQELWGVLIAYNLVRREMERFADQANVTPTQVSFVAAMRLITDEWFWLAGTRTPGAIPKHLKALRDKLARLVLPSRRPDRSAPRAVKIKMSNYPRKRPIPSDRN
jgi:hypothetical protein